MLPCNSSDSSDWLKICLYKYGAFPSIKSCMKQYLIFNCNYHSMKCRNKQSCQVLPKNLFPSWEQATNNRFSFSASCSKDIFDILLGTWWYLWTNCPEVILVFMKFQAAHLKSAIQNLHASLWCKLHRSTLSQLGTKLIFWKWKCCLVVSSSIGIKPRPSTSTQIMSKWFSFFVYGKLNFYANCTEVSK